MDMAPQHQVLQDRHVLEQLDVLKTPRDADPGGIIKDLVRLLPLAPLGAPVAWVPLEVGIEPAAAFRHWLVGRLAKAREQRRLR